MQFVLEEHLDILCSEDEMELEELMDLARDEFITSMLRIHQANSSRKILKTLRCKSLTSPFQPTFNMLKTLNSGLVAGRPHRLPDKEITKFFVSVINLS